MLVGITGRAQHGKDSTGKILVEEFGFKRYAFADQLKSMALALNPIVKTDVGTRTHYNDGGSRWDETYQYVKELRLRVLVDSVGWDEAKKNAEVRRFLQALGTEGVRDHIGEDAWVKALTKKLKDDNQLSYHSFNMNDDHMDVRLAMGKNVVVTDVRFPNEAKWVHGELRGKLIRVKRVRRVYTGGPGDGVLVPFDNGLGADHPSEKFVDALPADHEIVAEDLTELHAGLVGVMKEFT